MSRTLPDGDTMDWPEAVAALQAGQVVTRLAWSEGEVVTFTRQGVRVGHHDAGMADWLAEDWIVVAKLQ